jgi:hypothetical protein
VFCASPGKSQSGQPVSLTKFRRISIAVLGPLVVSVGVWPSTATGQASTGPGVETDVGRGPYVVGQGFELRLSLVDSGKTPKIEPPRLPNARVWLIDIGREPITATAIGARSSHESRYVIRLRVIAQRSGVLEIPSIPVQQESRAARSRLLRLKIQPVPVDGRPAEFLGGVGRFSLAAEAVPGVVRVGQELDFRIKVTGPGAWGMNQRPDLARFNRTALGLRIEAKDDETKTEPPERTFVYRLRPTRSGEAILPPVVITAFDPASSRFVTQKTRGVPLRVVAVPSYDPAALDDGEFTRSSDQSNWLAWFARGSSALLLLAGFVALARVRRRLRERPVVGPQAARRYAARLARRLGSPKPRPKATQPSVERTCAGDFERDDHEVARRVSSELICYLEIGVGRPPGALTPDEAREGVARLTGSQQLGSAASELATRCDLVLYGEANGAPGSGDLVEKARGLFAALGRAKFGRERAD